MPNIKKRLFYVVAFMPMLVWGQKVNFDKLSSPILFKGDSVTAYRDPMAICFKNTCYLYFSLSEIEPDGKIFQYVAVSKSKDLAHWSPIQKLTEKDQTLDFSSPGNIIRYKGKWIMCLQTYPRPDYTADQMPRFGSADARLFTMSSTDLETWSTPKLLKVKGDSVSVKDMGRMIDKLDGRSAEIVRKIGLEGASIAETGTALAMSEGAVRVALHRAFKKLAILRERHIL